MPYGGKTQFYQIPYMITDDYMTQAEEKRRATIIDSLLFIATYGARRAMLEDAKYTLTDNKNGTCQLTLSSLGGLYTLIAVVNGRLVYRRKPVTLVMLKGLFHYIYCSYTDDVDNNPEACKIFVTTEKKYGVQNILLCTVDFREETPVLNTDGDKQYLKSLAAHSMDTTNPHGVDLTQENLNVARKLSILGNEIFPSVIQTVNSPGSESQAVTSVEGMTPKFVTVMISDLSIGTVAVTINEDKTITVKNSGAADLPITLKIEGTMP